jgi:hypothetical protein
MRDAGEVSVQRAIVHVIQHVESGTVLSALDLDLGANEALRNYFSGQVANALGDPNTHPAKFSTEGSQSAKKESEGLLDDPDRLIPASQTLATLLLNAMKKDQRIAPGSLAVCLYRASQYGQTPFLALIKLDPGKVFVQKIEDVDGDRKVVTFGVQKDVMPTANEKLHKAALIAPPGVVDKYDLLLLDRQVAEQAIFWTKGFLNTVKAFDAKTMTDVVYDTIVKSVKTANLTPKESFAVHDWMQTAFTDERVAVSALVKRLPVSPKKKEVFRDELEKALPGVEELELDPAYAEAKLLKKTKFRGDSGVRFEVLSRHLDEVVKKQEKIKWPNGRKAVRVTLEVPDLEWI